MAKVRGEFLFDEMKDIQCHLKLFVIIFEDCTVCFRLVALTGDFM